MCGRSDLRLAIDWRPPENQLENWSISGPWFRGPENGLERLPTLHQHRLAVYRGDGGVIVARSRLAHGLAQGSRLAVASLSSSKQA